MKYKYILDLRTNKKDFTINVLKALIPILKSFPFEISKYDKYENCKKDFSVENIEDIFQIAKSLIFFKGKNKNCTITIMINVDSTTGIIWWTFFINGSKKLSEIFFKEIIQFLSLLNKTIPIIYGFLTFKKEFDYLHENNIYYDDGSRVDSWIGNSMNEFSDFLPGIYWFNIFGKELAKSLELKKIKTIPNVLYTDISEDIVAFHLNEQIDVESMEERGPKLYGIARFIGTDFFFNLVNMEESTFKHPPGFKKYLDKIQSEYLKK